MKKKVISSILLLILLLGCYTTSYAMSWEDVEDYIETSIKYYGDTGSLKGFNNQFLQNTNNYNLLKNAINIENYDTIICGYYTGTGDPWNNSRLYFLNSNGNKIYKANTFSFQGQMQGKFIDLGSVGYNSGFNNLSSLTATDTTKNNVFLNGDKPFVFSDVLVYTNNQYTTIANDVIQKQAYNYIISRGNIIDLTDKTFPFPIADARLGNAYNFNDTDFKLYYYNDLNVRIDYNGTLIYHTENLDTYTSIIITINENGARQIINGQTYYLEMLISDNLNCISNPFVLNYVASEEQTSGDKSGDIVIDLTETNQKLDNIIGIMEEQQETTNILTGQESGEKAKTFWENVYNNLFTMESGEVKEVIDNFVESTNLEELGTLEIEEQILNILKDEPRRFYNIMGRCNNTKFEKQ